MGYKLCIAEKPSVAKEIAKVVGADKYCNGYYEGNGYRVTYAIGHLVELSEPETYGFFKMSDIRRYKEEAMAELPLVPEKFTLEVKEEVSEQFEIVKKLMLSPNCDVLINCGDMGAEGHVLQAMIQWKVGYTKPAKRFCATSMTEEAIKTAMNNLRNQSEFDGVVRGEFCKKKADWILGMSVSRAETIKYVADDEKGVSVGRVQTPTLYFIVKRENEIKKFKITDYYGMEIKTEHGFSAFWNIDKDDVFDKSIKDSSNRVLDENAIKKKVSEIEQCRVVEYEQKKSGNDRPQLYDIIEIQRDANKKYGYTASYTLACVQCLYDTYKVCTYPRTDSRYITTDLVPYMEDRIKALTTVKCENQALKECAEKLLSDGFNIDKKIVDDSKVVDHHAILPTEKIKNFDFSTLKAVTDKEKKEGITTDALQNILMMIVTRLIVSFSKPCIFNKTSIVLDSGTGIKFTANGKTIIDSGWVAVQDKLMGKIEEETESEETEQVFPSLVVGQIVSIEDCFVKAKKTTPPKRFTEATLLSEMQRAGTSEKGGEILKGRGIGTQATRAEIIKSLFDKGYVEMIEKTKYIRPTSLGIALITATPKELYSPMLTADWENKIALIADGKLDEKKFMNDFVDFVANKIDEIKADERELKFPSRKEPFCACPCCGSDMYKFEFKDSEKCKHIGIKCTKKECKCAMYSNLPFVLTVTGKELTASQMKSFLTKGEAKLKCVSKFNNEKYDAVMLASPKKSGEYFSWDLKFADKPSSQSNKKKKGKGLGLFG